jgi:hypothetical protein
MFGVLIAVPLIVLSTCFTSFAYSKPDLFKEKFTQTDLIRRWCTINIIIASIYIIVCVRAGFNRHGLWMSIPCILLGAYIVGYDYSKLGPTRTFFGAELGATDATDPIPDFPFNLGHAQYKGIVMLLLGAWFAFMPTPELTTITGVWVLSYMVQVIVESSANVSSVKD